jgi:uridylate kinase
MQNYNTILIFGYGQTQLITDTDNILVDSSTLPSLDAVIEDVYSNKPANNKSATDYIRIAIYNNNFADWVNNNPDDYFKVAYSELNQTLINSLVLEIKNN